MPSVVKRNQSRKYAKLEIVHVEIDPNETLDIRYARHIAQVFTDEFTVLFHVLADILDKEVVAACDHHHTHHPGESQQRIHNIPYDCSSLYLDTNDPKGIEPDLVRVHHKDHIHNARLLKSPRAITNRGSGYTTFFRQVAIGEEDSP